MRNTNLIVWNTRNHCSNPLFLHFLWFFSIFWRLGVTLLPPPPIPSFNHFLQIFTLIRKLLINVNYCQQQGSAGAKQLQFLSCCWQRWFLKSFRSSDLALWGCRGGWEMLIWEGSFGNWEFLSFKGKGSIRSSAYKQKYFIFVSSRQIFPSSRAVRTQLCLHEIQFYFSYQWHYLEIPSDSP